MKKLIIDSGDEYRARIERRFQRDGFFYGVYCDAYNVLLEIEEGVKQYKLKSEKKESYLKIGNNIIAFSSTRGQGKTSALQSFSKYLSEYADRHEKLGSKLSGKYYVLNKAIDPTALTNGESIARVFISRLFEEFKHVIFERVTKSSNANSNEIEKCCQVIMELFQKCYSGIDCISGVKKADYEDDDLENLAQLGSSSKLREYISELIDRILEFNDLGCKKERCLNFLVVSIDDADLSMKNTYKICEEIRTYFCSYNIVVLLAADFQQIERSIEQVYIEENMILLNHRGDNALRDKYISDCNEMAAKYVEKMFPSGNRIELPTLDEWISEKSEKLVLQYNATKNGNIKNELKNCNDLQEQLLKLLFNRTGMIFLKNEEGLHPVLPITLRELNHFVKMLYSMVSIQGEWHKDNNLRAVKKNINIFEEYFFSYWCPNRLDESQQLLLSNIKSKKKSNKEVSRLIKAYVKKQGDESGEIAIEDEYLKIMFELVEPLSGVPNEEMLKQAIYIYYTIFLNKWFYRSWERRDRKKEMKKFVSFINHTVYLPENILTSKYRKKYRIGNFSCDNELLKYFLPNQEGKMIIEYNDWLDHFGKIITKEEYPDYEDWMQYISESSQSSENIIEFDWIQELKVNVLDSLFSVLIGLDATELPETRSDNRINNGLSQNLEHLKLKKEEYTDEYTDEGLNATFNVKNILVNLDVQFYVSNKLQKLFKRFYARKADKSIVLAYKEIYEEMDKWVETFNFIGIESSIEEYFYKEIIVQKDGLSRLCLCNKENFNAYCDELNMSNMRLKQRIEELQEKEKRLISLINKTKLSTEEEEEIKSLIAEIEKKEDNYEPQIFSKDLINKDEKEKGSVDGTINVFKQYDTLRGECDDLKQKLRDLIRNNQSTEDKDSGNVKEENKAEKIDEKNGTQEAD